MLPSNRNGKSGVGLVLQVPPELLDAIADRVVERLGIRTAQEPSPYLTVDEAAEYLRCSAQSLYDRVHQSAITPRRDGRRLLFARADLDAYLEGRAV